MASLLLEGLLAVLLVATIAYSAMLDRRLRTVRQSRDEMQALLASFTAATAHAQAGLVALRETGETTSKDLQSDIERAKALRDDLNFLLDRGNSLADRLEGNIGAARAQTKTQASREAARETPRAKAAPVRDEQDAEPVVRLTQTPKRPQATRESARQPAAATMPGAKVMSKRDAAALVADDGDEEMARQLLRALQGAR